MSTKKKTTSKPKVETVKTVKTVDKAVEEITKSAEPEPETKATPMQVFQFITKNAKVTAGNDLKLHNAKVIVYEAITPNLESAYKAFRNDIKYNLKITSDKDVDIVMHDMFGDIMVVQYSPVLKTETIKAERKKI